MKVMKNYIGAIAFLGLCLFSTGCCDEDNDSETNNGGGGSLDSFVETLRPAALNGVDAFIYDLETERNFENHPDFMGAAGTNGGVPFIVRSFIQFDFSVIPSDAIVDSVKLSLYSYDSNSNGTHLTGTNPNTCLIQKVNAPWEESLITWDNQPSSSEENQVVLVESESEIQDYLDIDITLLAEGMINTPSTNNGFVIKLETEANFRRMVFGSSDNPDANLHPKVVIYYSR